MLLRELEVLVQREPAADLREFFIPFFEVSYVYGLSDDMEWEAYYAPRLRGNTMRFSK